MVVIMVSPDGPGGEHLHAHKSNAEQGQPDPDSGSEKQEQDKEKNRDQIKFIHCSYSPWLCSTTSDSMR